MFFIISILIPQISKRYILADLYFDILVEELSLSVPDIQRITELTTNYSEITNKVYTKVEVCMGFIDQVT